MSGGSGTVSGAGGTARHRWLALAAMCLALSIVVIDNTAAGAAVRSRKLPGPRSVLTRACISLPLPRIEMPRCRILPARYCSASIVHKSSFSSWLSEPEWNW